MCDKCRHVLSGARALNFNSVHLTPINSIDIYATCVGMRCVGRELKFIYIQLNLNQTHSISIDICATYVSYVKRALKFNSIQSNYNSRHVL